MSEKKRFAIFQGNNYIICMKNTERNMKKYALLIAILLLFTQNAFAANKKVAVVNFTNNSGSKALDYLSKALADSISSSLAGRKDITVIERSQLGKVLNEVELGQTGLFEESDISKVGKLARADVLIIGSYTGNPGKIILSMKAVEVSTAKVIDARVITSDLGGLFDKASEAVLSMADIIVGKNIGFLTVTSNPDNADIFIDGMKIGETPLTSYKISEGKHKLELVKNGYINTKKTIKVEENQTTNVDITLVKKQAVNATFIRFGFGGWKPYPNSGLGFGIAGAFGKQFDRMTLAAEFSYVKNFDYQNFDDTYFGDIEVQRYYTIISFGLYGYYELMEAPKYISPYVGLFADVGYYSDSKMVADVPEEQNSGRVYYLGPIAGLKILPHGKFNLFFEARYNLFLNEVSQEKYYDAGLVGVRSNTKEIRLNSISLYGGFTFVFGN